LSVNFDILKVGNLVVDIATLHRHGNLHPQVDERRARMVLRQQQREEDYRRKKADDMKDPKVAVKVSFLFFLR
jgi:hypothetical protein